MAHDHEHQHGSTYFVDQLCTIATCGALGAVAILMYRPSGPDGQSKLSYILAPQFYIWVLLGGIALLVLVAIRAITLWRQAKAANHDHDHDHSHEHHHHHDHHHDHAHSHAHDHAHTHDHGHEHGWTPARYAVLMLPIVLYFLNLPNSSFSAERFGRDLSSGEVEGAGGLVASKGDAFNLGFKELTGAALYADRRADLEGKSGRLIGMFSPLANDKEFTLFRVKMNCCAADAIPVGVRIISPENITNIKPKEWVQVEGQIQFLKLKGQDKYLPVLQLKSKDQVVRTAPRPDYGLD